SRTAQLKSESGKTANPVVCQRKSQRRQFRKNSHRSHPTRMQTLPNIPDYVNMIFKGLKPGDLPVEQPTEFEMVIDMKAAKALGPALPQSVVMRADELIQ
ncbi:MAG: hypothetical protein WBE90_18085, partial [Xanthobacteraceae bacterium]